MAFHDWFSFALLSFGFCLIPGPSVCFTVAHALRNGTALALASIAGQLASNGLYILAISVGLHHLLANSAGLIALIRVVGVAYLFYLGVVQCRAALPRIKHPAGQEQRTSGIWRSFGRGFVVCATNPKTLIYYAAILPPFINQAGDRTVQLAILSATTLLAGGIALCLYAIAAGRARHWLTSTKRLRIRNLAAGGLMMGAALYLALGRSG